MEVGPSPSFKSVWSTNASDIAARAGLAGCTLDRRRLYRIRGDLEKFLPLAHDRMTEVVSRNLVKIVKARDSEKIREFLQCTCLLSIYSATLYLKSFECKKSAKLQLLGRGRLREHDVELGKRFEMAFHSLTPFLIQLKARFRKEAKSGHWYAKDHNGEVAESRLASHP